MTVMEKVDNEDGARPVPNSLGEAAGLMYCIAKVSREEDRVNKMKLPHILREQLEWIIKAPPPQPCNRLSVSIATQSYRDNKVKAPSAVKHRSADMTAVADTGCQAGYTASAETDSEELDLVPCSPNEDGSCSCPRREPVLQAFPKFD